MSFLRPMTPVLKPVMRSPRAHHFRTPRGNRDFHEFSNRDGELLPSGSTALEEDFGIGESDDFEITDINAPSLELSEVKEAEDLRDVLLQGSLSRTVHIYCLTSLARLEGIRKRFLLFLIIMMVFTARIIMNTANGNRTH